MKNIFKIFAICLAGGALFSSCKGFLDENPTTSLSETTVYTTEAALEAQVVGCYETLHSSLLWKGQMAEFWHTASGLMIWKGLRATDEWLDGLLFAKYSTTNSGNKSIWNALWTGVNRCNRLLDNLPASPVDAGYKAEIEGEVKFIRAWLYFTLVRIWGDVPMLKSSPSSLSDVNSPRTAYYKIYDFIIEDLEFAEQNMRTKDEQEAINFEKSRVYNYAATALKSTVYLTIGTLLAHPDDNFWDYTKDADLVAAGKDPRTPDFSAIGISSAGDAFKLAYDTANDVVTSGPYELCSDYAKLFKWTDHEDFYLPEGIFVLPSTDKIGGNYNSVRMLPNYPQGTNCVTNNSNYGRVRPSRFAIDNFIKFSGGDLYDGEVEAAMGLYSTTADPRFDASFFTSFLPSNATSSTKTTTYPNANRIETTSSTYSCPFFIKYLDPLYDCSSGNAGMYLIRLAEMYLVMAEAAANLSATENDEWWGKALSNVNVLRNRARNSGKTSSSAPYDWDDMTFSDKESLIEAIFWERWIELNAEGHEWFDTHRMGARWLSDHIAKPANHFYIDDEHQHVYIYYTVPSSETTGKVYEDDPANLRKSLLNAYPEAELRLNTSLTSADQNDFFWQ